MKVIRASREQGVAYLASAILFLACWAFASSLFDQRLLPSPLTTGRVGWDMLLNGAIEYHMLVSYLRIFSGWMIGSIAGALLGVLIGRLPAVRAILSPPVEFARFIPPISFVTLFVIWFGFGEASKVLLIAYTTVFIVTVNVAAGAASLNEGYIRAARSLGASGLQTFRYIAAPCCVPFVITGMRLAMGNAFMTIVAAEILAAKSGVGYLIWHAQMYMKTAEVFVGFAALCVMGFTTDVVVQYLARKYVYIYDDAAP